MKITLEIPDNTILGTISLATVEMDTFTVGLGTHNLCTADLVDGNTITIKRKIEESEEK